LAATHRLFLPLALFKSAHAQDLLTPPSDHRARAATVRLAYEREGLIGSNPAAVHVHDNRSVNIGAMPAAVRKMVIDKMIEITRRENPEKSLGEVTAIIEAELGDSSSIDVPAQPEAREIVTAEEVLPTVVATPSTAPEVDLPVEDRLRRREIVTQWSFVKSMHQFLGVE